MITVAAGDSFTWGSELVDSPHGGPDGYSVRTYSALLAEQAGMKYVCAAYPGNANNAISRMAIDSLSGIDEDKFLLAQWTYPQRAEFKFTDGWSSINSWHTNHHEFSESYFKHVGDTEYYEIYSLLKEIVYLQNYCLVNRIPFMFLTADNHFYQHDNYYRNKDQGLDNLLSQIVWDQWFWFPPGVNVDETTAPRGFYQWAMENKYKVGPDGHPLEQAHYDASLLMQEKFNELVKKVN